MTTAAHVENRKKEAIRLMSMYPALLLLIALVLGSAATQRASVAPREIEQALRAMLCFSTLALAVGGFGYVRFKRAFER